MSGEPGQAPDEVLEFMECSACAAKPGSPTLCASCLSNRWLIDNLRALPVPAAAEAAVADVAAWYDKQLEAGWTLTVWEQIGSTQVKLARSRATRAAQGETMVEAMFHLHARHSGA